jgi:hypothetical protein
MTDGKVPWVVDDLMTFADLVVDTETSRPQIRKASARLLDEVQRLVAAAPNDAAIRSMTLNEVFASSPELRASMNELSVAFRSLNTDPEPLAEGKDTPKRLKRAGIAGLPAKDVALLLLVALLLMHGGEGHPTALGEAIESNDLQVIAIVIALAAYLRKRE